MSIRERFDEDEPLLEEGGLSPEAWRTLLAPAGLREALLALTSAELRARARRRRTLFAGAVAAAYAAGLATAFVILGGLPESEGPVPAVSETAHEESVPETAPAHPVFSSDMLNDPEQFALLLARSPREQQVALLKTAGDTYLNEFGEVEQALHCYRRLLSIEPPVGDTQSNLDDTWLLRSLKQARLQEEHHENADS